MACRPTTYSHAKGRHKQQSTCMQTLLVGRPHPGSTQPSNFLQYENTTRQQHPVWHSRKHLLRLALCAAAPAPSHRCAHARARSPRTTGRQTGLRRSWSPGTQCSERQLLAAKHMRRRLSIVAAGQVQQYLPAAPCPACALRPGVHGNSGERGSHIGHNHLNQQCYSTCMSCTIHHMCGS